MSKIKIHKLDQIDQLKIVALDTSIVKSNNSNDYFVIYLWNNLIEPEQIFIQFDNLKVIDIEKNIMILQILKNDDVQIFDKVEQQLINICKPYIKKLNKNTSQIGELTFMSLISDFYSRGEDMLCMKLKLDNPDYLPSIFSSGSDKIDPQFLINSNVKIILELVDIQYDLTNKILLPDFRLRQVVKKNYSLKRVELSEYSFYDSDNDIKTEINDLSNQISRNFDIIQTEYIENDNTIHINKTISNVLNKNNEYNSLLSASTSFECDVGNKFKENEDSEGKKDGYLETETESKSESESEKNKDDNYKNNISSSESYKKNSSTSDENINLSNNKKNKYNTIFIKHSSDEQNTDEMVTYFKKNTKNKEIKNKKEKKTKNKN